MFKNAALAAWLALTVACTSTADALSFDFGDGVAVTSPAGWRLDGTLRATPPDGSCEQRADFVA